MGEDRDESERSRNGLPSLPLKYFQAPRFNEPRGRRPDFEVGDKIRLKRDKLGAVEDDAKRYGFKLLSLREDYRVIGALADGVLLCQDRDERMYWIRDNYVTSA